VVDIHSHLLPGIDDGPKDWETTAEMCHLAVEDGIRHIIATPHCNYRYAYDRQELKGALGRLRSVAGPRLQVGLGCDFHLSYENLQAALQDPAPYAIEDTNYMLIELSNFSVPPQTSDAFMRLMDRGISPILTHPERNPILQKDLGRVLQWVAMGVVVQVTGSALTGEWGEQAWRSARWLLEHDAVHVLASDAHGVQRRTPGLSAARQSAAEISGEDAARVLVDDNPGAIVAGKPLPYFPKV
jgi:protein-tyrosine phosphatase